VSYCACKLEEGNFLLATYIKGELQCLKVRGGQLFTGYNLQVSYSACKSRTTYCCLHEGELQGVKTKGGNFLLATYGAGELQCVQKEDNLLLAT
jgi:hypothetical protein